MHFPDFYDDVPAITLYDPLAELLGAAAGGLLDYRFADAVKLTGHACPTVAGAWLTGTGALRALYGDATPQRGQVRVDLHEGLADGVAGVVGSVLGLLTGAAGDGGFKGLAGRYRRSHLLNFGVAGTGYIALTRMDTGARVDCRLDLSAVPADPRTSPLLGAILSGAASEAEKQAFAELWQDRVRRILLDTEARPRLLSLNRA